MKCFRVRNFEKFQHYTDRRPPWIKLYKDLWHDPRFFILSESDRYQLISLFVLASQHDNKIPDNQEWLRHELCTSKPISLEKLIDTGWLEYLEQDASEVLAGCLQDAIPRARAERREETEERRDREETETEKNNTPATPEILLGEFLNVRLSPEDQAKLIAKFGHDDALSRIEALSAYLASNGKKKYANHYATILNWERMNKSKNGGFNGRKSKDDLNREAAQRLRARLDAKDGSGGECSPDGSYAGGIPGAARKIN